MHDQKPIHSKTAIILPVPPSDLKARLEMDIHVRFIRHLQYVPNTREDIKVLSTIQFVADMTGHSDAHVAKMLVDLGLRAPRMAFPAEFLDYADQALMREQWKLGGPSAALLDLKNHWNMLGEDRLQSIRRRLSVLQHAAHPPLLQSF